VSYVASVGITHECATRRDKKNRPRAAMPLYVLTLMGMTFAGCWAYGRSWAPDNKRPKVLIAQNYIAMSVASCDVERNKLDGTPSTDLLAIAHKEPLLYP